MNGAQLHLLINHLPVLLPLVGGPILAVGLFAGSLTVRKVGLYLLVMSALFAIPAYLSGDEAEDTIKNYPGVSRLVIHQHESAAKLALIALSIMGVASLLTLVLYHRGRNVRSYLISAVLVICLGAFIVVARAAHFGGLIRHEEIRGEP